MYAKLAGEIITKFKPYAIIVNSTEEILWVSPKLKNLKFNLGTNLHNLINNKNAIILIDDKSFHITTITLKDVNLTILIFDSIGDFNDASTKAYSLEKIIEKLYDGVLLTDKEGKIIIYNQAMVELEERDAGDMLGKYIWDAYGYNESSKSEHMQVYNSGVPILNKYKAHAYNYGKPIYKSYSTFPIKDGENTIGVFSISKNETKLQSLLSEIVELKRNFKDTEDEEIKLNSNGTRFKFSDIIGSSQVMKKLIKEAEAISWLDNSILLVGNTGTGKEVFAQSIHNFGKRKSSHFIGINCSAIPENLLESILFGTVKGAYTGAVDSSGLFEEAGTGTLFLDELNSMPLNMQTKLLRVLQERTARRVGGKDVYPIKCRVISAMNEDPYKLIEEEKLRQDLFYRIAGYNLYIPPLKERGNDLFELAEYYISKFNLSMSKNVISITEELRKMMENYDWPGNIRELEHFIENIMVRTSELDRYLRIDNIPNYILEIMEGSIEENTNDISEGKSLQDKLDTLERKIIINNLESNWWNVTKTAEKLGITRQSLIYRMRKLRVERNL
jgi:arginine utilization regulatory protein